MGAGRPVNFETLLSGNLTHYGSISGRCCIQLPKEINILQIYLIEMKEYILVGCGVCLGGGGRGCICVYRPIYGE